MRDEKKERYPSYVPLHVRAAVRLRKAWRQPAVRLAEIAARKQTPGGILPDGSGSWTDESRRKMPNPPHSSKCALWMDEDLNEPGVARIAQGIEKLKADLDAKGLRYTNTAATFLKRMFYPRSERSKMWENAWVLRHAGAEKGMRALDIGGASTPFSFYLASLGCDTAVLDNDWNNCGTLFNAEYVAKKMDWTLTAHDRDVARIFPFPDHSFDRVFSICTIEHLTSPTRRAMMRETGRILKPGGIAAITMCYDPNHRVLTVDKGLRFGYREKFDNDLLKPSGLSLLGNTELIDFGSEPGFLGAVFLRK